MKGQFSDLFFFCKHELISCLLSNYGYLKIIKKQFHTCTFLLQDKVLFISVLAK